MLLPPLPQAVGTYPSPRRAAGLGPRAAVSLVMLCSASQVCFSDCKS